MVAAAFSCGKGDFMSRTSFEAMPDVMDAKQFAQALQVSKAGAYNLLNSPDFEQWRLNFRLTAPYSEEWCKAASKWAKRNGLK